MSAGCGKQTIATLMVAAIWALSFESPRIAAQPAAASAPTQRSSPEDWPVYGGQAAGDHYSSLKQINRENVARLEVAWKFDTEEEGGTQASPIIVGRVLYAYTPSQKVIALDAATGRLLWKFDSGIVGTQPARGLAYWTDGRERRILAGVMNYLYALDPGTGIAISSFGEAGRIDLRNDLGGDASKHTVAMTTPGIVYRDLIIVGFRAPEEPPAPRGDIRAYDVKTGKLRWSFHTIPHPGELGYGTWPKNSWEHMGAANNWAGMALDERRGIVYAPTGSAVADFYGGDRVGDNLFADTLLALDAATGQRIWHFQGVHHDIWDRDFPSPPALVTLTHEGTRVDALAQTTKQGWLYLFDRVTGKPLFPIEERKYPASDVPGEVSSATQPHPLKPQPFARQLLTVDMLTERTPEAHAWAVKEFGTFRSGGQFFPLSVDKQTVVFPGFDGGAEWGGPAVDPSTGVLYVNANDLAWTGGLVENKLSAEMGKDVYQNRCAVCHGDDRGGSPPAFPSLVDVDKRLTPAQMANVIRHGRGRMMAFADIADTQLDTLIGYLRGGTEGESAAAGTDTRKMDTKELSSERPAGTERKAAGRMEPVAGSVGDEFVRMKYRFTGYKKFLDPDGYPAVAPPWGTLNAIDMNTGEYLWKIPLGEYPELAAKGMANTGTENYGGPIVTAGGLVFIGATIYDKKIRAFDSGTGKLLWQAELPFAGVATPATYMIDGKQYVVIAAGGGRDHRGPSGGVYVAFALP